MSNALGSERGQLGGIAHAASDAAASPGKATLPDAGHEGGASGGATGAPKAHPATAISFVTDAFSSGAESAAGLMEGGDSEEGPGRTLGGVSTTNTKAARWKPHGQFAWWIKWRTDGRSGWIVQKITNTYSGTDSAGTAITNASTGTVPTYYEAWAVSAGGAISPSAGSTHDMWERISLGNGSQGSWSMRGDVHWTTTDPATSGMTAGGVTNAGILLSSTTAPANLGAVVLTRHANGKWDSTGAKPKHTGTVS
ncbi:MAG TPA: hypothetical protein VGM88_16655 [Kofleriaceae bacterium]|jgi:hypothetical protein